LLDVAELSDYLSHDSSATADRFVDAFDATVKQIGEVPELGSPWESNNPRCTGLRYWKVDGFPKHLIFYRHESGTVEVLRVCHGARDLEDLF
jgi:toxin ParE1/3/4